MLHINLTSAMTSIRRTSVSTNHASSKDIPHAGFESDYTVLEKARGSDSRVYGCVDIHPMGEEAWKVRKNNKHVPKSLQGEALGETGCCIIEKIHENDGESTTEFSSSSYSSNTSFEPSVEKKKVPPVKQVEGGPFAVDTIQNVVEGSRLHENYQTSVSRNKIPLILEVIPCDETKHENESERSSSCLPFQGVWSNQGSKSKRVQSSDSNLRNCWNVLLPRRPDSNVPMEIVKTHRRSGSTGNIPLDPSIIIPDSPETPNRRRTLSGSYNIGNSGGHNPRSRLAKHNSCTDLQSLGGASVASQHSIVSDISKSALFQGVTENGRVQLRFPFEAIRLVNHNDDIESGRLYMQEIPPAQYEKYHVAAEELSGWEHVNENRYKCVDCLCSCNNCNGCSGKKKLLPTIYYAMKIEDDLYRRVLDEISESHGMPCGLFFCGHHEGVSSPSIGIAGATILLLFGAMGYIAFVLQA